MGDVPAYVGTLYQESHAKTFGLTEADFAAALEDVAARSLPRDSARKQVEQFHRSLRLEDLALARACAAGCDRAWDIFLARHRGKLFECALAIAKDDAVAHELAGSVLSDLFAKLATFTGRGSLDGWLRAVVGREYIDRYRHERKIVPFEDQERAEESSTIVTPDGRVDRAVGLALAGIDPEQRFILASYFLDGRRLAEIGRMLGVHESTASRKLERTLTGLRKSVKSNLRKMGMSAREADEAVQVDVRDLSVNVRQSLTQESSSPAFQDQEGQVRNKEVLPGTGQAGQLS